MTAIKWIGTSDLHKNIKELIEKHDIVFIEFEYHTDLMQMINVVKELHPNYTTKLFEADWLKWNYGSSQEGTFQYIGSSFSRHL